MLILVIRYSGLNSWLNILLAAALTILKITGSIYNGPSFRYRMTLEET